MIFSGIPFLYYFLPLTLALYAVCPKQLKNGALLFCSLIFYGWGEPRYVLLMCGLILLCYGLGLLVERYRAAVWGRISCAASIVLCLSFLVYFKYADFFLENINAVTGLHIPPVHAVLPIGISFYTFQLISYSVDVYRGETAQKNVLQLAVYIAMFPQLIAGPIVRYHDIRGQLTCRVHGWDGAASGIRRFVSGLAKKVLLANQLGELCGAFRASGEKSVLFCWLYAAALTLQIYFDFSGYSDMAIGLGRVLGFTFPENFDHPFIAASMTEFWRRWHISLGTWFRDYVYIPLGGSRRGRLRHMLCILTVWLLTGLWHGAAWNYLVWGLYFALLLMLEKRWLLKWLEKSRVLAHVYVLVLLLASFVIFDAADMGAAVSVIGGMLGAAGMPLISGEAVYCLRSFAVILLIGVAGATPIGSLIIRKISKDPTGRRLLCMLEPVVLPVLMLVITAYLVDGSFNPFLYFRF